MCQFDIFRAAALFKRRQYGGAGLDLCPGQSQKVGIIRLLKSAEDIACRDPITFLDGNRLDRSRNPKRKYDPAHVDVAMQTQLALRHPRWARYSVQLQ